MLGRFRFLQKDQPLPIYFFAVPRLCLRIMGYWPESVRPLALFNFVVLGIGVVTELHAGFMNLQKKQITLALETLCPASTSAVTLLKMFLILHYRKDLTYVLQQLREMVFSGGSQESSKKMLIMRKKFTLTARLNFWPLSTGFLTCTTYNLKPVLIALVMVLQYGSQNVVWSTPFNMTMPDFLLKSPFFPLTYLFIAYTGYVTIFMFAGCDAFYFEFCSNITVLLQMLWVDVRSIFRPYKDRLQISRAECAHIEKQLVLIIKRQNAIISLTHFFRSRYTIITIAHFVSASMVIGISIINLLTVGNNGLGALLYVAYTLAALSQLLIYCYGGTLVATASVKLSQVGTSCPWHLCHPRQRQYLKLLILRSQHALTMKVPFFSPSLATFASILQRSGSFIALAKSFQ